MTPEEVDAVVKKSVTETLLSLGINASSPEAIEEAQKDFQHLRAWRESTEAVKNKALLTAVAFLVTSGLGYLLLLFSGRG